MAEYYVWVSTIYYILLSRSYIFLTEENNFLFIQQVWGMVWGTIKKGLTFYG